MVGVRSDLSNHENLALVAHHKDQKSIRWATRFDCRVALTIVAASPDFSFGDKAESVLKRPNSDLTFGWCYHRPYKMTVFDRLRLTKIELCLCLVRQTSSLITINLWLCYHQPYKMRVFDRLRLTKDGVISLFPETSTSLQFELESQMAWSYSSHLSFKIICDDHQYGVVISFDVLHYHLLNLVAVCVVLPYWPTCFWNLADKDDPPQLELCV